jgi:hypothetical protein
MSTSTKARLLAGALLAATISLPLAATASAAPCNETVGDSINSYLQRHPDVKQDLSNRSQAEGGGPDVIGYLMRHPDVRQHLIDLSQQCVH